MSITDKDRLDFLDAINRQTNGQSGVPHGWTINYQHGYLLLSDEGLRVRPIREVIDEYHAACTSPVRIKHGDANCRGSYAIGTACGHCSRCDAEFERRVRTEDLRALALEDEEKRAIARAAHPDVSPGEQ